MRAPKPDRIDSIVFAPPNRVGGAKSLYLVSEALATLGQSTIAPLFTPQRATWFANSCRLYDYSYRPDVLVYPEIIQPHIRGIHRHVCFALGRYKEVEPHADLTVCKSRSIEQWVRTTQPGMHTVIVEPSIDRAVFEYDGREKRDLICYMTRPHKNPETAAMLRERYGGRVVEIVGLDEAEVAETLKSSKVFVWRGAEHEGSPRPPKEALVAGCTVVGLKSDLRSDYGIGFGMRCSSVDELRQIYR